MISPKKILWCGKNSTEMGCRTDVSFNSDDGATESYLSKEAVSSDSYDGTMRRTHMYRYTDVLSAQFTFTKEDRTEFTRDENRIMLAWLTAKKTNGILSIYFENTDEPEYELIGNFTSVETEKLANSRIVGYTCTFECISPYAYSPIYKNSYTVADSLSFILRSHSDEYDSYIYPKITITTNATTDVSITNHSVTTTVSTDEGERTVPIVTSLKNNVNQETVVLDGTNRIAYSNRSTRVIGEDFSWTSWMPLAVGKNNITVDGACTINFEWREPRKVGSL